MSGAPAAVLQSPDTQAAVPVPAEDSLSQRAIDAAGLPDLAVADPAACVEAAVRLAACPDEGRTLRARLLATRTTAPLFDTARFARHLEAAHDLMWDRRAAGRPPAPLTVAPV